MSSSSSPETLNRELKKPLLQQFLSSAPVTLSLIILNVLVFIWMIMGDPSAFFLPQPSLLLEFGANQPFLLKEGQWWRLVSYQFIHGGIIHLGFNMLALSFLGLRTEPAVGGRLFLVLYLVCGIGAGLASAIWQKSVSVGASGAIFGVLGYGFILERLLMRHILRTYGQKVRRGQFTGLVVANLILGIIVSSGGMIGIDNAAHIGGLVTGSLLTLAYLHFKGSDLITQNRSKSFNYLFALSFLLAVGFYLLDRSTF